VAPGWLQRLRAHFGSCERNTKNFAMEKSFGFSEAIHNTGRNKFPLAAIPTYEASEKVQREGSPFPLSLFRLLIRGKKDPCTTNFGQTV